MKKIISLILAAAVAFSAIPGTALGAVYYDDKFKAIPRVRIMIDR